MTEFLKRVDVRRVADLVSDNNARVDPTTLPTNANLLACLLDASGQLESACAKGQRYLPDDLAFLASTVCASQGRLFRFLTRLTMFNLYDRREDLGQVPEKYKATIEELDLLATGERIFGFVETERAGQMYSEVETAGQITYRDGVVVQAHRYFGRRANRSDPNRQ